LEGRVGHAPRADDLVEIGNPRVVSIDRASLQYSCRWMLNPRPTPISHEGAAMSTITVEEAKARLPELIQRLNPGEEVVITEGDRPVARLVAAEATPQHRKVPRLGTLRGTVLSMEHFDDPLEDFEEYMR